LPYVKKGSTGLTILIIGATSYLALIVFNNIFYYIFVPYLYDKYSYSFVRTIQMILMPLGIIPGILFLVGFVILNKEFKEILAHVSHPPLPPPLPQPLAPAQFCPSCGRQLMAEASVCPFCGKKAR
jgi:hypothetical protein